MKKEIYEIKKEAVIAMVLLYKAYTKEDEKIQTYEIDSYVAILNENLKKLDYNYEISTDKLTDNMDEMKSYGFFQKTSESKIRSYYIIDSYDKILRTFAHYIPDGVINASLIGDYCDSYASANNIIEIDTKCLPIIKKYIPFKGISGVYASEKKEAIKSTIKSLKLKGGKNISVERVKPFQTKDNGWYVYYSYQEPTYLVDITALNSKKVNNLDLEQHPAYKYLKRRPYINK